MSPDPRSLVELISQAWRGANCPVIPPPVQIEEGFSYRLNEKRGRVNLRINRLTNQAGGAILMSLMFETSCRETAHPPAATPLNSGQT